MCGLVGVITKNKIGFSNEDLNAFSQLLYADQLRGTDGTGIFYNTVRNKVNIKAYKSAIPSSTFLKTPEFDKAEKTLYQEANFAIGHNRAATKGKINATCTHPFREGHIILVHNGTLTTHKELNADSEVDSHAIAVSMSKIGSRETIAKINGAFALIWFDQKEKTLNLCRNWLRPLNIIETTSSFIICSEMELGIWIATRNSMKIVKQTIIEPKKLYKFHIEDMSKWEEETLEFYSPPVSSYTHDYSIWNKQSVWNKSKELKKSFAFGEKIRFTSGFIRTNKAGAKYLEGDILLYQHMKPESINDKEDYEDLYRINYVASEKTLDEFFGETDLIGTVCGSSTYGTDITYYVENVSLYTKPKTEQKELFPKLLKDYSYTGTQTCEDCGGSLAAGSAQINGFTMCRSCATAVSCGC